MKPSSLLFSLLGLTFAASLAPAAQVWVDGVSASGGGWIDYEKVSDKGDGDDFLCWAASASNIIDYWQRRYIVPEGTPTGAAIWERFKDACLPENGGKDTGGHFVYAMQWWIGGDYEGSTRDNNLEDGEDGDVDSWMDDRAIFRHNTVDAEGKTVTPAIKTDLDTFDGFFWETIPDEFNGIAPPQLLHVIDFMNLQVDYTSMAQRLISQISAPISLGIVNNLTGVNKLAHAITLWGMEYDENTNTVSKLWITDSDDYETQLEAIDVYYEDGNTSTLYLDIYGYKSTMGDARVYIDSAYGINLAESDTWDLVRVIPEPATTTLSLLALAGLAARRRRR